MQQTSPFDLLKHARDFQYDYVTVVDGIMSHDMCQRLRERINEIIANGKVRLVNHQGQGTTAVSDLGGRYLHHIFQGNDVREHLPELVTLYRSILPLVSAITNQDAVLSPHQRSDINIKVYPPGGGTLGEHYDTMESPSYCS